MLGVGDQFPDGFLLNGVDRNNNMVTYCPARRDLQYVAC